MNSKDDRESVTVSSNEVGDVADVLKDEPVEKQPEETPVQPAEQPVTSYVPGNDPFYGQGGEFYLDEETGERRRKE